MQLQVNGEATTVTAGNVESLVRELGLDPRKVAVERNLEIVPRSTYPDVVLVDGDRIEIVQFVGGG